ncbi:hypothetical protein HPB50_010930 [Hyalomma asiaticum]|uniref:Uncharacterized protein n=1 Tax=Hyalomma asiaticum TaxID=266040 RepID=A0ACB7TFL3_HYAAI|nr:hypothetical protein HPB50_010930 [Hyalomma asiaticum]
MQPKRTQSLQAANDARASAAGDTASGVRHLRRRNARGVAGSCSPMACTVLRAVVLLAASALRSHAVCIVPDEPFREIRNASDQVQSLIQYFRTGAEKGVTHRELSQFVDRFGSRMLGSVQLEKSIDYLVERFGLDHFQDVHTEDVLAVRWRRQHEVARLVRPEEHALHILGLGGSSGTPPGGVTAPLDVVKSFAELEMKGVSVKGHIVLYMPEWKGHSNYAGYLLQGTTKAARLGALGVLFRAPEPLTGTALFAGLTGYEKDAPRIAAAVVTKQDADLLVRMVDRNMSANDVGSCVQYILLGAHVDSWDIGQGAADNAAAVFIIWRALSALKRLELLPKRTVRFVVWTAREQGMEGATEFFRRYAADSGNTTMAMELDLAAFAPTGLALSNVRSNDTVCIVREMLKEFETIDANGLTRGGGAPELRLWREAGVPVAGFSTAWYYHNDMRHSEADTVSGIQSDDLDLSASMVAGLVHMLGQMEHKLPR